MSYKSKIKAKIYSHYFKKGMLQAIQQLKDKNRSYEENIPKVLSDINIGISTLKNEVEAASKALGEIEQQYGKNNEAEVISTGFSFLDLSMIDIFILYRQYLSGKDEIEKNFICRTAAQHMYEFLDDASEVLGKQMSHLIENLNDDEINAELKALRKTFNELKKELQIPLKILRHNVSAHKDRDIRNQLAIINAINIIDFHRNFESLILFFITLTQFKKNIIAKIEKRRIVDDDSN